MKKLLQNLLMFQTLSTSTFGAPKMVAVPIITYYYLLLIRENEKWINMKKKKLLIVYKERYL